jgi:TolB-like protein/DNA-binding SARP family transcriptional activator/Tfp pilus assembly protein PilF
VAMLYLRAFGGLSLEDGGRPIVGAATQRARLALLALLATAGDRGVSRDRVLALFWPDKDVEHARAALRQALYTLRRDAGEPDLILGTAELALNRDIVGGDILEFDAALGAGNLEAAIDLYRGALLDGLYLRDVPEFERWAERERDRRLQQYRAALEQLATAAAAREDFQLACAWWERLVASDPLSATFAVALMKALVRAGDHSAALQHARDHERAVRAELDVAPDPSVVAVVRDIRAGLAARPRGERVGPTVPASATVSAIEVDSLAPEPTIPKSRPRRRGVRLALLGAAAAVVLSATLVLSHGARQASGRTDPAYRRTAIAVLPFQNLSIDPSHAYFAAGLHDELLTQLSKVAGLKVTSRQSVMGYAGTHTALKRIASELEVGSVVEASVQVVGNRLRVTVQLIDASTDAHLWSEHYDRTLDDALSIESEVARQIVAAVGAALSDAETRALAAARATDPEAYLLYLQGRIYHTRRFALSPPDLDIAQHFYERALRLDSSFALAHAALSELHGLEYITRYDRSPSRAVHQREEAAAALRLAPDLPEAHRAMGSWHYHARGDYARALAELRIAVAGLPNDVEVWARLGQVTRRKGDWNESVRAHEKTTVLDPRNAGLFKELGVTYTWVRRYPNAVAAYDRALTLAPDMQVFRLFKAMVYAHWQGQLDTLRAVLRSSPWSPTSDNWTLTALDLLYWDRKADSMVQVSKTAHAGVFEEQNHFLPASLYAGWAHQLRGDRQAARRAFASARVFADSAIAQHADDERIHAARGLALAGLGDRAEALREARWLQQSRFYREDKFQGGVAVEARARILAQLGDADAAIDELESLLARPSLFSVHMLRLDPGWDRIRAHPRFKALLAMQPTS